MGVIRDGRSVVWECPHRHVNRDQTTFHISALRCSSTVLTALRDDDMWLERLSRWLETARFTRSWEQEDALRDRAHMEDALRVGRKLREELGLWFSMTSVA